MSFAFEPPLEPMLAKPLPGMPDEKAAAAFVFEPKWDGFRALIYRDADQVSIQGRMRAADAATTGKWDLTYAFPEMVQRIRALPATSFVLDGELVVMADGHLDFARLGMRLRPRKEAGGPKIAELARDHPTSFVAFDALADHTGDLRTKPFTHRRRALVDLMRQPVPGLYLTPQTKDLERATSWFNRFPGAGLDGLMAKPRDGAYEPGKRAMFKVKHRHTVDVVCAGWRPYARTGVDGQEVVGSLLLGVYDQAGVLQMIGAASAFTSAKRADLAALLNPLAVAPDQVHPWLQPSGRAPGGPSRWGSTAQWYPIRPELVCEVAYDQLEGDRLRHLASFIRWRPDRSPESATDAQLFRPEPMDLAEVLASRGH